jgi:hypothetical protein
LKIEVVEVVEVIQYTLVILGVCDRIVIRYMHEILTFMQHRTGTTFIQMIEPFYMMAAPLTAPLPSPLSSSMLLFLCLLALDGLLGRIAVASDPSIMMHSALVQILRPLLLRPNTIFLQVLRALQQMPQPTRIVQSVKMMMMAIMGENLMQMVM